MLFFLPPPFSVSRAFPPKHEFLLDGKKLSFLPESLTAHVRMDVYMYYMPGKRIGHNIDMN